IPVTGSLVNSVTEVIASCNLLLAIIGPGWVDARDEVGNRCLDNEHDLVRIEITAAEKRGIPVIPVLLEDAFLPMVAQLPEDLWWLAFRRHFTIRDGSFRADVLRLLTDVFTVGSAAAPRHEEAPATGTSPMRAPLTVEDLLHWSMRVEAARSDQPMRASVR